MQSKHEHNHGGCRKGGERGEKDRENQPDKEIMIFVNGREKTVGIREELTFDQLVSLAFDEPPIGKFIYFTITYRRGPGNKPEGTLVEGKTVKVKDGMIFNVTATDKS